MSTVVGSISDEGSGPPEGSIAEEFATALEDQPADERVYRVALQLTEPARVAVVAERVDCAVDTARRHLRRLVDIGVLRQDGTEPATFSRNESYFEWRKRNRLANLSESELQDRLSTLANRIETFRERYDASEPAAVDALEHTDHVDIETVWQDLSEWQTVRERIERIEAVRRDRAGNAGVA
ncbi:MAG: ArsR family transcriptional regulator [Halorientalis sp.]